MDSKKAWNPFTKEWVKIHEPGPHPCKFAPETGTMWDDCRSTIEQQEINARAQLRREKAARRYRLLSVWPRFREWLWSKLLA